MMSDLTKESKVVTKANKKSKLKTIDCGDPWFSLLKNGSKTVEGRRISPLYQDIKEGDHIIFKNPASNNEGDNTFTALVTKVNRYAGAADPLGTYLETETLVATLPGITTMEEGRKVYLQFYTEEQLSKSGMLAIHIKPIF